jgi:Peptidase C13 family
MPRIFLLIVVGLAGDPDHGELFQKWGQSLADTASRLGVAPEHLMYLAEPAAGSEIRVTGRPTREGVTQAFHAIAEQATAEDAVFVVLIGHGTFDGRSAKFNMPGPDMSAEDFNTLLKRLPVKQLVFVNTSSASGPFVGALSGPGRVIVTATRSGAENFATLFGGYFTESFGIDAADADKNGRVSILEAFQYATLEVGRAYEREGLLVTEHALLDDNGDKEGSSRPAATGPDGKLAAALTLGSGIAEESLPSDPRLRALHLERRALEGRIEALRLLKEGMDPARYTSEFEKLATELALKTREIRTLEGQKPN